MFPKLNIVLRAETFFLKVLMGDKVSHFFASLALIIRVKGPELPSESDLVTAGAALVNDSDTGKLLYLGESLGHNVNHHLLPKRVNEALVISLLTGKVELDLKFSTFSVLGVFPHRTNSLFEYRYHRNSFLITFYLICWKFLRILLVEEFFELRDRQMIPKLPEGDDVAEPSGLLHRADKALDRIIGNILFVSVRPGKNLVLLPEDPALI